MKSYIQQIKDVFREANKDFKYIWMVEEIKLKSIPDSFIKWWGEDNIIEVKVSYRFDIGFKIKHAHGPKRNHIDECILREYMFVREFSSQMKKDIVESLKDSIINN